MKYTTYYSKVERVVYEYDKSDIERLILADLKLTTYQTGRTVDVEIDSGDTDSPSKVIVTVKFEKENIG